MSKLKNINLLYRAYGCTTKEQFDNYKKHNRVMSIKEFEEAIESLKKNKLLTKSELIKSGAL